MDCFLVLGVERGIGRDTGMVCGRFGGGSRIGESQKRPEAEYSVKESERDWAGPEPLGNHAVSGCAVCKALSWSVVGCMCNQGQSGRQWNGERRYRKGWRAAGERLGRKKSIWREGRGEGKLVVVFSASSYFGCGRWRPGVETEQKSERSSEDAPSTLGPRLLDQLCYENVAPSAWVKSSL
jgi:hypothetical protein